MPSTSLSLATSRTVPSSVNFPSSTSSSAVAALERMFLLFFVVD